MFGSPRTAAVARFAGSALLLCVLGLTLLADLGTGSLSQQATGRLLYLPAGVAGAVALPAVSMRLRGGLQAWSSCGAALVSLACSGWLAVLAAREGSLLDQASDSYTVFEPTALIVLLNVTARRGSRTGTAVALPLLTAAVVLRPLAIDVDEGSSILALLLTLVAGGSLAAGLTRRLVVASRRQREEQVRLEQRLGFARDLHDFVAHHISGIVVQAQGARAIAARKPQLAAEALELIENTGTEALTAMRRMVGALREDTDGHAARAPGTDGIRALAEGAGLDAATRYSESGPAAELPADAARLVERVVMEALTNVRKHARDCTAVQVALDVSRRRVTARITDDGRPGEATDVARTGGGYGLRGLREVAEAAGGTLTACPVSDAASAAASGEASGSAEGWQVTLRLPLPLRQVRR
jgi:signal transduction histidine kinase